MDRHAVRDVGGSRPFGRRHVARRRRVMAPPGPLSRGWRSMPGSTACARRGGGRTGSSRRGTRPPSTGTRPGASTRSSGSAAIARRQPFIRPIDVVEDRANRSPVAPLLDPGVDRVVVVEVARPRRRRFLTAVGGSLETGDRAVPPAEQVRGEVLEAPRPHRSGLGHPVDADLVDQVAPDAALALAGERRAPRADRRRRSHTRSNAIATDPPPPRHSVASP